MFIKSFKQKVVTGLFGVSLVAGLGYTGLQAQAASSDFTHTVRSEGFIGPEDGNSLLPGTLVQVTVPTVTTWLVNENTEGQVESPTFTITNESPRANLEVTLVEYRQTNDVTLRGDLDLNFTGDLREGVIGQDVFGMTRNTTPFSERLLSEAGVLDANTSGRSEWTFSFEGTYSGAIPVNALQPEFDLELAFSIDSYTINP